MKILGLDLSTHTGWAVLTEDGLSHYGVYHAPYSPKGEGIPPDYEAIDRSEFIAEFVDEICREHKPDRIYIEQTNGSKNRESQKQLEFIHAAILIKLRLEHEHNIRYIDTSQWRKTLSIRLSKDQKKHNKKIKEFNKAIATARSKKDFDAAAESTKKKNEYKAQFKIKGKTTPKHLAVIWANQTYGLQLKHKDNDIADAIALAKSGIEKEKEINTASVDIAKIFSKNNSL